MSAMLMAICFTGMDEEETKNLTLSMAKSGDLMDLSAIHGKKIDKHSTGGVGDKTTLVIGPLAAAAGVPVAKMSGRGLGHTGGTIDKLESFHGFHTSLTPEQFIKNVNSIHIALAGQTANLAPADKKIYALRDVTGTVDQMSLIASSIMSKKLASGADGIVLDVKTGDGAFMKTLEDSKALAREMVQIGTLAGRDMSAVISDMDQPLGYAVGNALEVKEAIATLNGNGPKDLRELVLVLTSLMVVKAGKAKDIREARILLEETLDSGKALQVMKEWIVAQVELRRKWNILIFCRRLSVRRRSVRKRVDLLRRSIPKRLEGFVCCLAEAEPKREIQSICRSDLYFGKSRRPGTLR